MPQHALAVLLRCDEGGSTPPQALFLRGEALKELGRFSEAIAPLREAAEQTPDNVAVWLALGWCYKRMRRVDMAIQSLEEALEADPSQAIVHYNLACYWSLAGSKRQSLIHLSQAIEIEPDYRDLIADESDFDPIRNDPAFQALASVIV